MQVRGWKVGGMIDHPQGHLISDYVASFGYVFVIAEAAGDDLNEISFGGSW